MISAASTIGVLESAVRGGIGDHRAGEIVGVFVGLRAQVGDVDIAVGVAGDGDDLHAGHDRAGRIGAVGGDGNEANAAGFLSARLMIGANGQQPGVFALRAGVGLKRDGGHAGDFRQPCLELPEQRLVAARLVGRREGMEPADRRARRRGTSPPWR